MKDRIKQLMDYQQLTQQSFAEMIKISPASLSSIFNDRTKPTLNHVDAILKCFPNLRFEWLLYGEGEMYKPADDGNNSSNSIQPTPSINPTLQFEFDTPVPTTQTKAYNVQRQPTQTVHEQISDNEMVKILNKPQRKITEIRVFYDDQTWESFLPQK